MIQTVGKLALFIPSGDTDEHQYEVKKGPYRLSSPLGTGRFDARFVEYRDVQVFHPIDVANAKRAQVFEFLDDCMGGKRELDDSCIKYIIKLIGSSPERFVTNFSDEFREEQQVFAQLTGIDFDKSIIESEEGGVTSKGAVSHLSKKSRARRTSPKLAAFMKSRLESLGYADSAREGDEDVAEGEEVS